MLEGVKRYRDGFYVIKVDGFPQVRYLWFSRRDAEREYREQFNLKYKRIYWYT